MDVLTALARTDIYDPKLLECPFPFYKSLHAHAPVLHNPELNIYQVSTHELVLQVLRDEVNFSNHFGAALRGRGDMPPEIAAVAMQGYPPVDTMLTADPPAHTRYRKLVNKAFAPSRVAAMEKEMQAICDDLIDQFASSGEVELLSQFAQPLPLRIIATQLGVPLADMEKFRRWSDAFTMLLGQAGTLEDNVAAMKEAVAFQHYFANVLETKRANPSADIVSDLATVTLAEEGDPRVLTTPEALSIIQQILVAGNETTASSICGGVKYLLESPKIYATMMTNPEIIPNLVEEVLRICAPVQNTWRFAAHDVVLGGVAIPKGAQILLRFGAANRDAALFPEGDVFDPARANARRHLSFGSGIHVCLGATLSRKELAAAFAILPARLKKLRFAPGKNDFTHWPSIMLRGPKALHLEFDA